jgi:hypothetical protein
MLTKTGSAVNEGYVRRFEMKPIKNPDINRTDKAYWEMILKSHGLGMNRGTTKAGPPKITKNEKESN